MTARYAISTEEVDGVSPFETKSKKATAQQRAAQRTFVAQTAGDPHAELR